MSTTYRQYTEFGQRLARAMKAKGFNQSTFAKKIGLSQSQVSRFLLGKDELPERNLMLWASVLGDDLGFPWLAEHAAKPFAELSLIGEVCAGRGIDAHTDPEAPVLNIPTALVKSGESFCLKVRGDSMVGDGIHDGDVLVVRRQNQADVGQVVIALHEGQVYVRRLAMKRPRTVLASANPAYPVVTVAPGDEFEIQAVVTGLIRNYEE